MELIQISDSKLKIMLSDADMARFSLDAYDMDYSRSETRRAFRQMLDSVRDQSGFDTCGERIFVQVYPSNDGGCEVFVTKLGTGKGDTEVKGSGQRDVRGRECAYSFGRFDDMLVFCRYLYNCREEYRGEGAAYRDCAGRYYLSLPRDCGFAHCDEYSRKISPAGLEAYISEHGRCLVERGAVEILGKL